MKDSMEKLEVVKCFMCGNELKNKFKVEPGVCFLCSNCEDKLKKDASKEHKNEG